MEKTKEPRAAVPTNKAEELLRKRQAFRRAETSGSIEVEVQSDDAEKTNTSPRRRKLHLQRWRDISWMRRILMLASVPLFFWSAAPAFIGICNIGVVTAAGICAFVFLAALLWHLVEEHRGVGMTLLCTAVGLVFTVGMAAFCFVSGLMLKASMTEVPEECPDYTVVVLGCLIHDDQPSWMLTDRLERAYRVLEENPDVMCVVSGGQGDNESYTEAYVMKKYLVEKGIAPSRIVTEEASSSTEENLLFAKNAVELNGLSKNIVIVTDRFHELRARIWAQKAGFRDIYAACCETRPYLVVGYWFREMFGLARLYVFGR